MSRDLYAAYSGATVAWRQLETVSNNIANAGTAGFREARLSFQLAPGGNPNSPLDSAFAQVADVGYSRQDGALLQDGNPHHMALRGDGFFALEDGSYTRDGSFRRALDGTLITENGTAVLGEGGPVRLEPHESFTVDTDGTITGATSGEVGKLRLVSLAQATPLGGNRWQGVPGAAAELTVLQGVREGSNADPLRGMVELVEASRYFEAQQKAMQASDEMQARLNRIQGG
jgi:flagellar basal-body rod protein FlgF